MSFLLVTLLILILLIGLYSFLLLDLNSSLIQLDLIFIDIDIPLGNAILISFLFGLIVAVFLEIIFFSAKGKRQKDEWWKS